MGDTKWRIGPWEGGSKPINILYRYMEKAAPTLNVVKAKEATQVRMNVHIHKRERNRARDRQKLAFKVHVSACVHEIHMQMQGAIGEPTLLKVITALQDPVGLEVYVKTTDPHPNSRLLNTARLQLLWKLQRNKGSCEYVGSDGKACTHSVWDWLRRPAPWMQLEWHHADGKTAMYIGQYRTPRTLSKTHAQLTLLRAVAELGVCQLLCRRHHTHVHLPVGAYKHTHTHTHTHTHDQRQTNHWQTA